MTATEGLFYSRPVGSKRRFCDPACRQAAWRRRKAGVGEATALQKRGGRSRGLAGGGEPRAKPARPSLSSGSACRLGHLTTEHGPPALPAPLACPLSAGTASAFSRNRCPESLECALAPQKSGVRGYLVGEPCFERSMQSVGGRRVVGRRPGQTGRSDGCEATATCWDEPRDNRKQARSGALVARGRTVVHTIRRATRPCDRQSDMVLGDDLLVV